MARSSKKVRISIRFNRNPTKQTIIKPALDRLNSFLREAGVDNARDELFDRLIAGRDQIKADVEADLDSYIKRALAFFLTQISPNPSATAKRDKGYSHRVIKFNDLGVGRPAFFSSRRVKPRGAQTASRGPTVTWAALSPETIRKKRREGKPALTFFHDTGELATLLRTRLGEAFKNLLAFDIDVDRVDARGPRLVNVKLLPGRRVTSAGLAALIGPDQALQTTGNNRQLVNMLQAANLSARERLVEKLTNGVGSKKRPERPFLQPVLGYWLVNRLPYIFDNAVAKYVLKG